MNFIITTKHPAFGRGYFNGFTKEGAMFQSSVDRNVKRYKNINNANKQLSRILSDTPDECGEHTQVESTATLDNISDLHKHPNGWSYNK